MSPNLLEDEKLNYKIEKIFENRLFQKVVEEANVLEDAGDLSLNSSRKYKNRNMNRDEDYNITDNENILGNILNEQNEILVPYEESLQQDQPEQPQKLHKTGYETDNQGSKKEMKRIESQPMFLHNKQHDQYYKSNNDNLKEQLQKLNNESANILIDGNEDSPPSSS